MIFSGHELIFLLKLLEQVVKTLIFFPKANISSPCYTVLQVSELVGPVAENQEAAGPTHALRCMHPREFILLLYVSYRFCIVRRS